MNDVFGWLQNVADWAMQKIDRLFSTGIVKKGEQKDGLSKRD